MSLLQLLDNQKPWHIEHGDCLDILRLMPDKCIQVCVTSPPYYALRDYGLPPRIWGGLDDCEHEWKENKQRDNTSLTDTTAGSTCSICGAWKGCLGLEPMFDLYIEHMVEIFREVRRVLRDDGVFWLNIGDSYANRPIPTMGLKPKDQIGIPHRLYFALQEDGWYGRNDCVWAKPNPGPSSVQDRLISSHEYVFLLAKSQKYFFDYLAIREPSVAADGSWRSKRSVWSIPVTTVSGKEILADVKGESGEALERDCECPVHGDNPVEWYPADSLFASAEPEPECSCKEVDEHHFAQFPVKLVEPMILAGTSEKGCCSKCGKPYTRKVKTVKPDRETMKSEKNKDGLTRTAAGLQQLSKSGIATKETVGWKKPCRCKGAEVVPCVVMDIFNGSGTTGISALRAGCRYLGLELNDTYVRITERRLTDDGF